MCQSPGEGNGNPLQYSCLENSVDRGAWWAIVHGAAELDTTEQLTHTHINTQVSKWSQMESFERVGLDREDPKLVVF